LPAAGFVLEKRGFLLEAAPLPACGAGGRHESSLKRKKVTRITDDAALPLYPNLQDRGLRGGMIMIWTSDRAGVLLYTIVGMFLVLSSICLPA
jgi:hypothetical protein